MRPGGAGHVPRGAWPDPADTDLNDHWRNRFSDDLALFRAAAPGCLMRLGTGNPDKGVTESWHRPGFDVDEDALLVGVRIISLAELDVLS